MARKRKVSSSYSQLNDRSFCRRICDRIFSRQSTNPNRTVYVGRTYAPVGKNVKDIKYPDNRVISSKYTLLTFLPKNLFEQIQRIANFYFLCVACIQVLLGRKGHNDKFVIDTPVTPLTSILPLSFVISVTAIKQGYEDWLRHKADKDVNLRPTIIIKDGEQQEARSMDIKVGDIVKVQKNEEFPCDLVMLSSEDPLGQCSVTTANLDGETSLKSFFCLNETRDFNTLEQLEDLQVCITCMPQVTDLYKFEGVMVLEKDTEQRPLGPENLLLRGARLKNTKFIYGCAVYTGKDTKMSLNSKSKKTKFSRVERKMNIFLLVILTILFLESVVSAVLMYWFEAENGVPWYVASSPSRLEALKSVEHALAFMVLYNYIIPISLYVTVEMQKFLGSLYFGMDIEMYDCSIKEQAQANTSDLNEELGQVEYLFTDKTGTLTENIMMFRKCCIGTRQFEAVDGAIYERLDDHSVDLSKNLQFTQDMDEFFKVLVLCHTVRLDQEVWNSIMSVTALSKKEREYQATSPDEKALVTACSKFGIVYHGSVDNVLEVLFHGMAKEYRLLHVLPFDPTRKRMSVIVQDDKEQYFLLCKGAEVAILDRIEQGNIDKIQNVITEYAMLGLRTLTIAQRLLSPEEFSECDRRLTESRCSLVARDELLAQAYDEIERKFTLLGATAVEDKLQDQVPQTIEALRMAGIKVWVLTGDKEETAVNISHAAGHFHIDMHELHLTHVTSAEDCAPQLEELMTQTNRTDDKVEYALIINGHSLAFALKDYKNMLLELCSRCVAVLCCRMSPIQKAEVVAMVKHSPNRPVTAAIGDGANDVSMLQEADVGIGIMGKEGRQAVRNSDYAFGKFKFLRRALLVHGHLYYNRIAVLVQYFFYKNVAWITAQVFYAFFNSFSQQSLFDPFYLMFYNLTFTSLPILIYGLFEQHIPQKELFNNPELYRKISRNATLSWCEFIKWNMLGLWHCFVVFFGIFLLQLEGVSMFESGVMIGNYDFGNIIIYSCALIVNLKLLLETYYWCVPTLIAYTITAVGNILLSVLYTNVSFPSSLVSQKDMYKALNLIFSTPVTWIAMFVLIFAALLPDIILRVMRDTYSTSRRKSYMFKRHGRHITSASLAFNLSHKNIASQLQPSTGFDNPLMSLSDENHPSTAANSQFIGQDPPATDSSSKKPKGTIDSFGTSISPAASASSSCISHVNGDDSKTNFVNEHSPSNNILRYLDSAVSVEHIIPNNVALEQKPADNLLHFQDATIAVIHQHPPGDRLEPPVGYSWASTSIFPESVLPASQNRSTLPTSQAVIESTEHLYKSNAPYPAHSEDFSDHGNDILIPTFYENDINYIIKPTQPEVQPNTPTQPVVQESTPTQTFDDIHVIIDQPHKPIPTQPFDDIYVIIDQPYTLTQVQPHPPTQPYQLHPPTLPVDVTRSITSAQPYTSIAPFWPSPSHVPAHQHPTPSLSPTIEYVNTNTHSADSSPL